MALSPRSRPRPPRDPRRRQPGVSERDGRGCPGARRPRRPGSAPALRRLARAGAPLSSRRIGPRTGRAAARMARADADHAPSACCARRCTVPSNSRPPTLYAADGARGPTGRRGRLDRSRRRRLGIADTSGVGRPRRAPRSSARLPGTDPGTRVRGSRARMAPTRLACVRMLGSRRGGARRTPPPAQRGRGRECRARAGRAREALGRGARGPPLHRRARLLPQSGRRTLPARRGVVSAPDSRRPPVSPRGCGRGRPEIAPGEVAGGARRALGRLASEGRAAVRASPCRAGTHPGGWRDAREGARGVRAGTTRRRDRGGRGRSCGGAGCPLPARGDRRRVGRGPSLAARDSGSRPPPRRSGLCVGAKTAARSRGGPRRHAGAGGRTMSAALDRAGVRRFVRVALGGRGAILLAVAIGAPFLLTLADLATAALLVLFLRTLGLATVDAPRWLPGWLVNGGPVVVWAVLLGLVAAQGLLHVVGYQSKIVLSEGTHFRLRLVLGRRFLPAGGPPPPLSRLGHLSAEVLPRAASVVFFGVQFLALLVQTLTLAVAMLWIVPGEALIGLAGFVLAAAAVRSFSRRANEASARMPTSHLALEQIKVRAARNWLLIRALRLHAGERARYAAACADHYRASVASYFFANLGLAVTPVVAVLVLAVTALAREWFFGTSPASFVAFLYLFVRFQYLLANASQLVGGLFSSAPQLAEAAELIAEVPESELVAALDHAPRRLVVPLAVEPPAAPLPPTVKARDLVFRWPGNGRAVIDGLDVDLAAGAQLGVTGPNGSGKSTLLALLLGVVTPERGSLTFDGEPAATWAARHPTAIGYVGPEACLHAGSVCDNLRYGLERPCANAELLAALARAGFGAAPDVLDRAIREDGEGLSSGEKQKLALARALLRAPVLLLLDEPTANVDERSETEIAATLARLTGTCTVILVSHEPAVLAHADVRLLLPVSPGRPAIR